MRLKPRIFRKPQLTHTLARGLVGYWLHNEGSGLITNDVTGNGNYGAVTGATWIGEGLNFDGNDKLLVPYAAVLDNPASFTLIVRARSNIAGSAYTDFGHIMNMGGFTNDGYGITVSAASNKVHAYYNSDLSLSCDTDLDTNWHVYAITFDGANLILYRDGVPQGSPAAVGVGVIDNDPLAFGVQSKGGSVARFFDGIISDSSMYSRHLSAGEILRFSRDPYILFRQDPAWMGQAAAAPPSPGQVIFITKAEREAAAKAALPLLWACQGSNDRRDFMKHTGLAIFGL